MAQSNYNFTLSEVDCSLTLTNILDASDNFIVPSSDTDIATINSIALRAYNKCCSQYDNRFFLVSCGTTPTVSSTSGTCSLLQAGTAAVSNLTITVDIPYQSVSVTHVAIDRDQTFMWDFTTDSLTYTLVATQGGMRITSTITIVDLCGNVWQGSRITDFEDLQPASDNPGCTGVASTSNITMTKITDGIINTNLYTNNAGTILLNKNTFGITNTTVEDQQLWEGIWCVEAEVNYTDTDGNDQTEFHTRCKYMDCGYDCNVAKAIPNQDDPALILALYESLKYDDCAHPDCEVLTYVKEKIDGTDCGCS